MRWEVRTMRSGTSCFNATLFRKHLLRFWPVWAVQLVILALALPLNALMLLRMDLEAYGGVTGGYLENFARYTVPGMTDLSLMLAVVLGLLAAMAACSHLYSQKSANFMGALPVRREGLFFSHYLAGLVTVLGPGVIAFLLTLLVELTGGCLLPGQLGYWLGYTCSAGFFFYTFAVFLGMFTGHILALPAFYGIFNLLAFVVMAMLNGVLDIFYYGFGSLPDWVGKTVSWLTPVVNFGGLQMGVLGEWHDYGSSPHLLWIYPLAALALAAGALLLYRRRNLESAGDVVAVRVMRPVFQYGVALCAGLFFGMMTRAILNLGEVELMVAIFLWGIAGYFVARMLLSKSFRVLRYWKGAVAVGVAFLALFAVVGFDLTGFETRVPRVQDVASVSIRGLQAPPFDGGSYVDAVLDDPEDIAAAVALHQSFVDRREWADQPAAISADEYVGYTEYYVTYQLKDGSTLSRNYDHVLVDQGANQTLQALLSDPEVILQSYALAQMEQRGKLIWAQAPEMGIAYGEEARTLLDAVLEDIAAGRLGVHTLGGTEDAGMPEVIFQWRVSGREDEPPYYGTDYEREIRVAVPDTASSTLAVMERLAGQNG